MSKRRKQPKTSSDPPILLGIEFWRSLSFKEAEAIFDNGGILTGEIAERAWRMCDMQGPAPERLEVYLNRQQFMQWLDEKLPKAAKKARERKLQ